MAQRTPGQPSGWRLYNPPGFTTTPEVMDILGPYLDPDTLGGCQHFSGLPVAAAERLLALLPPRQAEDAQNSSPSFGDMVRLLRDHPGATLHGYRIVPERQDERISIEGFLVPIGGWDAERMHALLQEVGQPDESYIRQRDDGPWLYCWWD